MRKSIALLLVLAMVFSLWIPAYAEDSTETVVYQDVGNGTTTIDTTTHYDYVGKSTGSRRPLSSDANIYANNWFDYKLNFLNSGLYKVSMNYTCYGGNDSKGNPRPNGSGKVYIDYVDGNSREAGSGIFEAGTTSKTSKYFCTIMVDAGQHDFRFVNGSVALGGWKYITFEYLGNKMEYTKDGSECNETDVNPKESLEAETSASYTFDTAFDGTYGVYATVEADGGDCYLSGMADGDTDNPQVIEAEFNSNVTEVYFGAVTLTKGIHNIMLMNIGTSSLKLKEIKLIYTNISEEESVSFIEELKNAKTRVDLDRLLTEYNDKFMISYADYLSKIFSKEIIYTKLLRFKFETVDEFDAKFMALYNEEVSNPFVEITQEGNNVTELQPGAFIVTVNPRLPNGAEVITALYNDDYTELKATDKGTLTEDEPLVLEGLTAEEGFTKLKVFFIEDTNKVKPSQLLFNETTIFVSPDGIASNSGLTPDKPIPLSNALIKAKSLNQQYPRNIVVNMLSGEYVLDSTMEISEKDFARDDYGISFVGDSVDNPPVISGGYDVEGWTDADGDGIYEATLPSTIKDVRQLYINDYPAQRARSNKYYIGEKTLDDTNNNVYVDKEVAVKDKDGNVVMDENGNPVTEIVKVETSGLTQDGFSMCNPSFPKLSKPEHAELAYINKWALQRLPVKDIDISDDDVVTIWMEQPYYSVALTMICDGGVHPTVGGRFYVENDIKLLDECGEFYYDKDTRVIYYKPFPEEDLQKVRTVIGKTEQLLTITGSSKDNKVKNVSFNNIKFRHGGYYTKVNSEGAVTFQAENLANAQKGLNQNAVSTGVGRTLDTQILVENAENIEFKDCDISSMGTTALRLGSAVTDSSVTGCIFTDIGGSALSIGTWESGRPIAEDITLKNNVIARTGLDFMFCPAVSIYYGKNISTLHNTIAHTPYTAISVNWGWAYKYAVDNDAFDTSRPSGANKLGVGGHETAYNYIYDISNSVKDGGHIYNVGYSTDHLIHDNYLTDSPDYGGVYMDTGSSNVKTYNNVFERCDQNNIMGGGNALQIANVAENNWADDAVTSSSVWKGEGSSLEPLIVVSDGNWPEEAQSVMDNAGVEEEYETNLSRIDKPSWRTIDHLSLPKEEGRDPNVTYLHCDTWKRYFKAYASSSAKRNSLVDSSDPEHCTLPEENNATKYDVTNKYQLPTFFYFSGYPAIGNFSQNDCIEYEFTVPKNGKYSVAVDYHSTKQGHIYVFITEEQLPVNGLSYLRYSALRDTADAKNAVTFKNNTIDKYGGYFVPGVPELGKDCYVPHEFLGSDGKPQLIELKAGTKYYLRLANGGDFGGFSRFRFKLYEETK